MRRVCQIQALRHWKAASVKGFQSPLASCSCKNVVFVDRLELKLYLGIGSRKALEGLDLGGVWSHAVCSEHSTVEGSLRLPDLTFQAVEDNAMFLGCLHQLEEVSVMLLRSVTTDTYHYMAVMLGR